MARVLSPQAIAAAAIRKELKAAFPHVKFSVRCDHASLMTEVNVDWRDGPTADMVHAIIDKYAYGRDYDNRHHELPAQVKYVGCGRTMSAESRAAIEAGLKSCGWECKPGDYHSGENTPYHLFLKADLSVGPVLGVRPTNRTCGMGWEFYEIVTAASKPETDPLCPRCDAVLPVAGAPCAACAERMAREAASAAACRSLAAQEARAHDLLDGLVAVPVEGDVRMVARFASLNKNCTLERYVQECDGGDCYDRAVKVTHVVRMSADKYDLYAKHLMVNFPWLSELGGSDSDVPYEGDDKAWCNESAEFKAAWLAQSYFLGVLVLSADGRAMVVAPEGYGYARYVGLVFEALPESLRVPVRESMPLGLPKTAEERAELVKTLHDLGISGSEKPVDDCEFAEMWL